MESRVSNLESKIDEFQATQEELKSTQNLILHQLQARDLILHQLQSLMARCNGGTKYAGESSAATPTHQPFIKMTYLLSLEKLNQIVLQLQSFHNEKVRAREKVDELWSQFRPRYKPKTHPCLRPILKKFKKVRNYDKHHDAHSATFRSNPRFQESFWFFRSALARKNEKGFDLLDKQVEDSVKSYPFLDSVGKTSTAKDLVSGLPISELLEMKDELPSSRPILEKKVGFQLIVSIGTISKLQSFKNLDHDFSIRSDEGFIFDAKQMLLPAEGVAVHLGHNVFNELPHSTKNCVLQLGYHMPISDSGGTLITGHFTSQFHVKDAYNSKFRVCNGEFLKNGTTDLRDEIVLVVSNFCDKNSVESKIMAVGFVGFYPFMDSQPSIVENECQQELVGMYAHHVVVEMQQTVSIVSLNLGFHVYIRDKGGTRTTCKNSGFCVVFNHSMGYYYKGIRDKGGDGDIPHRGIGNARRMQVPFSDMQHTTLIEAVGNHMPRVIVIDEIGTKLEALAASTIVQRGIQLVATAHGVTIKNLIMHPSLEMLVGGIQSVTLGDKEASRRGVQKTVQEKKCPATFSCAVKIISKDELRVHRSFETTVDAILYEFNSMDFLAICQLGFILTAKKMSFLEEADPLIVPVEKTFLAFHLFGKIWFSSCCIVLNCDMCYWKGIWDKGEGSKFSKNDAEQRKLDVAFIGAKYMLKLENGCSVLVENDLIIQAGDSDFYLHKLSMVMRRVICLILLSICENWIMGNKGRINDCKETGYLKIHGEVDSECGEAKQLRFLYGQYHCSNFWEGVMWSSTFSAVSYSREDLFGSKLLDRSNAAATEVSPMTETVSGVMLLRSCIMICSSSFTNC